MLRPIEVRSQEGGHHSGGEERRRQRHDNAPLNTIGRAPQLVAAE